MGIKYYLKRLIFRNSIDYARHIGVKVGENCRFSSLPEFGSEPFLCEIGNHVMIASDVQFITHDSGNWVFRDEEKYKTTVKFGKVKICDNCYIGVRVILMPNVTIGENSIIGAGSIVTKSVEPNSVYAGIPARYICSVDEYAEKILKNTPDYNVDKLKTDRKNTILEIIDNSQSVTKVD